MINRLGFAIQPTVWAWAVHVTLACCVYFDADMT